MCLRASKWRKVDSDDDDRVEDDGEGDRKREVRAVGAMVTMSDRPSVVKIAMLDVRALGEV